MRRCAVILQLLTLILVVGCGHADDRPEPLDPPPWVIATYVAAVDRVFNSHLDGSYIVTRKPDGSPEHLGEAGLWSWLSLAYLPCERAGELLEGLTGVLQDHEGWFPRYLPLPDTYRGREWNFDGETLLQFGIASVVRRCPVEAPLAVRAWALHEASLDRAGGELYPGVGETMPPPFDFTRKALSYRLLGEPAPKTVHLRAMEIAAASWAASVAATRSACYRVHLAYRHLRAAEASGFEISTEGRDAFCAATATMEIPNLDHWCGRPGLKEFAEGFEPNRWEMRFQRCGAWESEDGDGDRTPGLDLIEAIAERYDLSKVEGLP